MRRRHLQGRGRVRLRRERHCSICRRATGAAFKPTAGIERAKLCIASGGDDILSIDAPTWRNERCGRCGSLLYALVRDGTFVHVAMGTLLDDPTVRPSAHIFVGSKAPWFTITDDLPQHYGTPAMTPKPRASRAGRLVDTGHDVKLPGPPASLRVGSQQTGNRRD